jgi:hypothetical protein
MWQSSDEEEEPFFDSFQEEEEEEEESGALDSEEEEKLLSHIYYKSTSNQPLEKEEKETNNESLTITHVIHLNEEGINLDDEKDKEEDDEEDEGFDYLDDEHYQVINSLLFIMNGHVQKDCTVKYVSYDSLLITIINHSISVLYVVHQIMN